MNDERPLAEPWRVEAALSLFPHREMTPAEYAARHSHTILCSSFDEYRYPDPELGVWIDELHRLLRGPYEELDRCRRTHLTAEEYAEVQEDLAYQLEHGL